MEKKDIGRFLKERLGLGFLLDHMIPSHSNSPAYAIGGTVIVLMILQIITGVMLQQFYHPMPDESASYNTILYIVSNPVLNIVRNLHYWGAQVILVLVILHMVRVYVSAAYRKPREMLWVSGIMLLVIMWLFLFTGSVLKWDQEAVEALGHNLEIAKMLGPLGYWFNPSFAPNIPILIRVYAAHVTLLPIALLLVLGLHIYLIRILGISNPKIKRKIKNKAMKVPFSTHIKKMFLYGSISLIFVAILAFTVQAPLSSLGNTNVEVSKPDWYLLWMYSVENYFGLQAVPYVLTIALILMALVPAIDRSNETDPRKRKSMMILLILGVLLFVLLTINAALTPPQAHLG